MLKNTQDETDSWYIDLKDKGVVGKGEVPEGKKADGEFQFLPLSTCLHLV